MINIYRPYHLQKISQNSKTPKEKEIQIQYLKHFNEPVSLLIVYYYFHLLEKLQFLALSVFLKFFANFFPHIHVMKNKNKKQKKLYVKQKNRIFLIRTLTEGKY